jgi:molecular chaperone GrpE
MGTIFEKLEMLLENMQTIGTARDKDPGLETYERNLEAFFKAFIPVMDILDSIKSAIVKAGDRDWIDGFDSFYEKLFILFSTYDLKPTARSGMAFDPAFHEAAGAENRSDLPNGTIAEIVRNGWTYKGRLMRFAQVIVSKSL